MSKKITDFRPQSKNVNQHSLHGTRLLEESVQRDGWISAMTAATDGEIFDGSNRINIAAEKFVDNDGNEVEPIIVHTTGDRPVIVVRDDIPSATDPRAKRLSVAANQITATDWNPDGDLLKEWGAEDEAIKKLFAESEWTEITGEEKPVQDAEPQTNRAAELLEKWQVKTGDLWQIGEHRVYCGDFRDANQTGDNLIFDPPWDLELLDVFSGYKNILAFSDGQRAGDIVRRFGAPAWVFVWHTGANWYTPSRPLKGHKNCLWYGDVETYKWDGAFYGDAGSAKTVTNTRGTYQYKPDPRGKHLADLFSSPITQEHEGHSHGKPLDWVRMLIGNCSDGVVHDPFLGTGTSLIAAQQLGRQCVGSEIEPSQVALILERAHLFGIEEIRRDE